MLTEIILEVENYMPRNYIESHDYLSTWTRLIADNKELWKGMKEYIKWIYTRKQSDITPTLKFPCLQPQASKKASPTSSFQHPSGISPRGRDPTLDNKHTPSLPSKRTNGMKNDRNHSIDLPKPVQGKTKSVSKVDGSFKPLKKKEEISLFKDSPKSAKKEKTPKPKKPSKPVAPKPQSSPAKAPQGASPPTGTTLFDTSISSREIQVGEKPFRHKSISPAARSNDSPSSDCTSISLIDEQELDEQLGGALPSLPSSNNELRHFSASPRQIVDDINGDVREHLGGSGVLESYTGSQALSNRASPSPTSSREEEEEEEEYRKIHELIVEALK